MGKQNVSLCYNKIDDKFLRWQNVFYTAGSMPLSVSWFVDFAFL